MESTHPDPSPWISWIGPCAGQARTTGIQADGLRPDRDSPLNSLAHAGAFLLVWNNDFGLFDCRVGPPRHRRRGGAPARRGRMRGSGCALRIPGRIGSTQRPPRAATDCGARRCGTPHCGRCVSARVSGCVPVRTSRRGCPTGTVRRRARDPHGDVHAASSPAGIAPTDAISRPPA